MPYRCYWYEEGQTVDHAGREVYASTSLFVDEQTGRSAYLIRAEPERTTLTREAAPSFARDTADKAQTDFQKTEVYQRTGGKTYARLPREELGQHVERENLNAPNVRQAEPLSFEQLDERLDGALKSREEEALRSTMHALRQQAEEDRRQSQQANKPKL